MIGMKRKQRDKKREREKKSATHEQQQRGAFGPSADH